MSYAEQLKHPNWQRKRLQVLDGAKFSCIHCGESNETLHVHHKWYVRGRLAWEYGPEELETLCESCHTTAHESIDQLCRVLARSFTAPEDFAALVLGIDYAGEDVDWPVEKHHKEIFEVGRICSTAMMLTGARIEALKECVSRLWQQEISECWQKADKDHA